MFAVTTVGAQTALLNAKTVVDGDSTNAWNNFTAPGGTVSTQNVGRVWTDKSVFDDTYTFEGTLGGQTIDKGQSDFIVGLSALSSTSNLKETIRTTTPLDIVLVLDQSGSMANSFSGGMSRRDALQNAANNFIDSAAALNNGVEQENQIRMSVVTFDTYASVSRGWTYVSGNGTDLLHGTINGLSQSGATRVDLGLGEANDQLGSARTNAKKVVIVFTDGDPTSGSSFENEVAADAINTANTIKQQRGATVYTIGIFSGANPNTDNNANNYMNAVSSNYPSATAVGRNPNIFDWDGEFSITWGDGSRNNGYYKNASNSDELNQVFDDIFNESTEDFGSGSPIVDESEEGNTDPGILTFTDQLGSYMEVTGTGAGVDKIQVVYGDQIISSTSKTTAGNVDTYHFSGTVGGNAVYGEADLTGLVVTVTRFADTATGDLVSVTIPADLLPLRNYDVDTENGTMTVTDAYPIRLFYGVSLKSEVRDALDNPMDPENQDLYNELVAAAGENPTIDFYTNSFVQNQANGETTAVFEPNAGNKFYYYTTDTDLYIDAACTQRANRWNIRNHDTLYYRDNYWVAQGAGTDVEGGKTYQATNTQNDMPNYGTVSINGADWSSIQYRGDNAYIPGGTQRQDRPNTLVASKEAFEGNKTGTATNVLAPEWSAGDTVTQHLGNNGKLSVPTPGSLEVKKTVNWGNASEDTKAKQGSFTFTVSLTDAEGAPLAGGYPYAVYGDGDEPVQAGTVGNGGTVTIATTGEMPANRFVISLLPDDAKFTVTEQGANENGFATTDHTAQQGVENDATDGSVTGTVEAGSQISVDFTNTYSADEPVMLSTSTTLMVQKVLDGRAWRDTDSFEFNLSGQNNAPMPEGDGATVVVTNGNAASFGDIEFAAAGTYTYIVTENDEVANPILGIDYSNALYTVTVVVADGGQGNLKIDSVKIEQTTTDQSGQGSGAIEGNTMTFTNTYSSDTGSTGIDGFKDYTDGSGDGNPLVNGKFSFQIEALGGYKTGTVEGEAAADDYTVAAAETPMPEGTADGATAKVVTNDGNQFHFGNISFGAAHVGMTFEYRVTELELGANGQPEANMSYDDNSYVLKIEVTEEDGEDDEGNPEAHIVATPSIAAADLRFENTFTPDDVTLGEDGAATINGTKALDGRDMTAEDEFNFTLKPYGETTTNAIAANEITGITDAGLTAKVNGPEDENEAVPFSFSGITFTKAGTYQFVLDETETGSNGAGITYDEHTCIVTVKVGVDHATGKLTAAVSYDSNGNAFVNTYKANMNYGAEGAGGIELTKTMNDRPINNGDFVFNLNGEGPEGQIVWAQNVPAAAMGSDGSAAKSTLSALQNLTFDQDDAGKTFTFTVTETVPAGGDRLAGVVYDQSEYEVAITVVDDGDGSMHTLTTVTQTKDAEGQEIADGGTVVVNAANSDAADYAVPSFGFTNSYEPESVTTSDDTETTLQVTKTVEGAPSPDGVTYEFTLTPADTNPAEVTGAEDAFTAKTTGAIAEGGSETVSFGALTFTKPGTYTFTVQESAPAEAKGWEYDTDPKTITVTVDDQNPETQEYDGKLYITEVTRNPAEVKNSYEAEPVIVGGEDATEQITVKKTVTGANSSATFTFQLAPVVEEGNEAKWENVERVDPEYNGQATISSLTQGDSKTATFGGIRFTAEGTYEFTVTEVGAEDFNDGENRDGWTYDEHVAHVTVTVTDDGHDGQLDAKVTYDNIGATPADRGERNAAAFTNAYEAARITVDATEFAGEKTVSGRPWLDGETFGFTMEKGNATEGGDWAAVTTEDGSAFESATATAEKDGDNATVSFDFGEKLTFSQAGVYTFNVTETQHDGEALPASDPTDGMTYDRHTGVITVEVTDNGTGNLEASVSKGADEASGLTFKNTYEATPVTWGFEADELLGGHKYIDDTTGNTYTLEADAFSFTMRAQAAANPMPEGWDGTMDGQGRGMMTVTNGTGNATEVSVYDFGSIEFTHDDMTGATAVEGQPGLYTKSFQYNIFESGDMPAGISKDNTAYTVTFTVTEDYNTGEMTVTPSAVKIVNGGSGEGTTGDAVDVTKLDFTNTYNPTSISSYMNIFKTLDGRNWQTGDTFTFNVSMTATEIGGGAWPTDAPLPSVDAQGSNYTISDAEVNEAGNGFDYTVMINPSSTTGNTYRFDTGKITYEREGVYTYTVSEAESTVANVTADDTEYTVVVTVTDNGGVLERKVTSVTPELGNHGTGDQGFTALDFTNTFTPTAFEGVPDGFFFTKQFTGHEWTDDYSFSFVLTPQDDAPMPTKSDSVSIDGQGNAHVTVAGPDEENGSTAAFNFGNIKYEKAGTYKYTVNEEVPAEGSEDRNAGITYDTHVATVTVTVTEVTNDDGEKTGELSAEAAITAEEGIDNPATFSNTYDTNDVTIGTDTVAGITVQKTLSGRTWEDDDAFNFSIARGAGNDNGPLPEESSISVSGKAGTTDAGRNAFGVMTFTHEMLNGATSKDFVYTVTETSTDADGVKVDTSTERAVTVTVTDDGEGGLSAQVKYNNSNASADADKTVADAAAFTNMYGAAPTDDAVPADFSFTKVFTGHEWTDGYSFEFVLTPFDGAPMPEANEAAGVTIDDNRCAHKTVSGPQEGTNVTFDFGGIVYNAAGKYKYTVAEVAGNNDGIDYASNTAEVTVVVTDKTVDGHTTGKLVATATVENGTFTNDYDTGNVEIDNVVAGGGLKIVKNMTGRKIDSGAFTFTIEGTNDASIAKLNDGNAVTVSTKGAELNGNTASETVAVPTGLKFTLDDAGETFEYKITEQHAGETIEGVTYDGASHTVKYVVSDGGDGTLTVNAYLDGSQEPVATYTGVKTRAAADPVVVTFNNSYDAGSTTVGGEGADVALKATKELANRPMSDGEFTFNVTNALDTTDSNPVVLSGKNDVNGNVTFDGSIKYTMEKLNTDVENGLATRAHNDETGADVYTYTYTVAEDQSKFDDGITAVAGSYSITVTVTDDGEGNLTAEVVYPEGGLVFKNIYGNGDEGTFKSNLAGNKVLSVESGDNAPDITGKYTFTVTVPEGAPAPERIETQNDANGNVDFGEIIFTMENVFGSTGDDVEAPAEEDDVATESAQRTEKFEYTVTESGSVDGVTNDPATTRTIVFTVTDNGDGTLSVEKSYGDPNPAEGKDFTFTNTYKVKETESSLTGEGNLTLTKKLVAENEDGYVRKLNEGEFTFELFAGAGTDNEKVVASGTNDANGNVELSAVTFTEPGTFTYTLREVNNGLGGVAYDTDTYQVTAVVTDNGNGTLSVAWTVDGAADNAVTYENVYKVSPTTVDLSAAKFLTDTDGIAVDLTDGQFTFQLKDGDKVVSEAKSNADGAVNFDMLEFDAPGTYTYTISEVPGDDEDITYDDTVYTVTIVVTDDGAGNLSAEATYQLDEDTVEAAVFNNTLIKPMDPTDPTDPEDPDNPDPYDPWIDIDKELTGRDLKADEFPFTMALKEGDSTAVSPLAITTTNDADGSVIFDKEGETGFVFSKAGEYTFTISETKGDEANVTYDETEYTVRAVVTAGENGALSCVWQLLDAEGNVVTENPSITFHNVYEKPVTPPTPVDPDPSDPSKPDTDVDKKLTGRDLVDGEFSFTITVSSDNASHVSPKSLTGTNDASGNVTFGGKGFVFDEAGDYTFIVAEVLPSDDDPDTEGVQHNGVTYDPATFTITAHVTEQNGKLVVTWENADVPMVFENEYEPEETVDITFGATKVLEGRDLAAGEFSFELRDQDGNVVATATNAADGSIVFTSPVTFTEPGEYTYTIVEVSGNVSGVTYDDAVHTAVVTVTDNGDGTLSATVTYDGSGKLPVFTNVFTPSEPAKPEKPSKPGIPQTGDFAVAAIGGTGLAAVALIATGLYLRRRNSH